MLGHARSGSNLVGGALAEHPQIRYAAEELGREAKDREIGWASHNPMAWPHPRGEGYQTGEDGAKFLETRIFSREPWRKIRSFGFKIFYNHAQFDEFSKTAWDYIRSNDVHIIHIVRRNILDTLISREVATRTQQWYRLAGDPSPVAPPPFALDPQYCSRFFDQIVEWRDAANKMFANHKVLKVDYENDLCMNFSNTMMRLYDFLGVMNWYSRPRLVKQQGVPASQQLSNFKELGNYFSGTSYAEFFTDRTVPAAKSTD